MTDKEGKIIPVTLVEAGPCYITQIKKEEKDGYAAVQVGFKERKKNSKPLTGHFQKSGKSPRFVKEFRVLEAQAKEMKEGDKIDASVFAEGDKVTVSGVSKGKGYAGVIKRWNFSLQPATHGTKDTYRAPGSIGSAFPQRVIKGRKMAGRQGSERTTVKNLEIMEIDQENNLIALKGAVPGRKGTLLEIKGYGS